jgi:hypothetical protein
VNRIHSTEVLFLDADFREQVGKAFRATSESVDVLVGFAKVSAMQWLADQIEGKELNVSVVVGWTLGDLAKGSSDLDAYTFARERNWRFGIRPELHAKIFWADRDELLIGSANLTTRGFHLGALGNIEAGARITPTNVDKTKLDQLIAKSLWLDDGLFEDISRQLDDIEIGRDVVPKELAWPKSIVEALADMRKFLWVDDMFMTNPLAEGIALMVGDKDSLVTHDQGLLGGLFVDDPKDELADALRRTVVIRWLKELLGKQDGYSARFGTVSAALHDALMDDPKPYRSDVKALQSNLFTWIEFAEMPEFELIKHRRTTSIHLVPSTETDDSWF